MPRANRSAGPISLALFAQRILPLGMLATALLAVPWLAFSSTGLSRLEALRKEKARTDAEVSRLSQEIRELRAEVQRIKQDPRAVERVARDELGLVRRTELVFQFRK